MRALTWGILRYDHPDILRFIHAKDNIESDPRQLFKNFNISVGVDAAFFEAVKQEKQIELVDPHYGKTGITLGASYLWDEIATSAHKNR